MNKCGFHIVEFCNKHHRCNNEHYNQAPEDVTPGTEDFFRFEKVMKAPFPAVTGFTAVQSRTKKTGIRRINSYE